MRLVSEPVPLVAVLERPHSLLEAPRLGADGEIVYSDVIAGGVWGCGPEGEIREIVPRRRGVGGIVPHAGGGWVISGSSLLHVGAGPADRGHDPDAQGDAADAQRGA